MSQIEPSPEQRAWAAGFFDGEGWASSARYSRRHGGMTASPVIGVGQAEPELLERFLSIVGVGTVRGPTARGMFAFKAHGQEKVERLAALLWPWLGSRKREQITRVLEDARQYRRCHPRRAFSDQQVLDILEQLDRGDTQASIARKLGCPKQRINGIARGRYYRTVQPSNSEESSASSIDSSPSGRGTSHDQGG
jgi:hypothetical protein